MSEERLERIEGQLEHLIAGQKRLDQKVDRLAQQVDDNHHQMLLLHEQMRGDIQALAPDYARIRREFTAADTALHHKLDRRLPPVETWIRGRNRRKKA